MERTDFLVVTHARRPARHPAPIIAFATRERAEAFLATFTPREQRTARIVPRTQYWDAARGLWMDTAH